MRGKTSRLAWLFIAGMVFVWELAVRISGISEIVLPGPWAIVGDLLKGDRELWLSTAATLTEVLLGLAISGTIGVALGALVAFSGFWRRATYPVLVASQTIPVISLAPLVLMWAGPGIWSKVIVIVLWCFFPICLNVADGLYGTDKEIVKMLNSLGASRRRVFWLAQAPNAMGALFTGLKMAAVLAVAGAVVGEWIGGTAGIGHYIRITSAQLQTTSMFSGVVVLNLMGIGLFRCVEAAANLMQPHMRYSQWGAMEGEAKR